jgi:hypothetical protein
MVYTEFKKISEGMKIIFDEKQRIKYIDECEFYLFDLIINFCSFN